MTNSKAIISGKMSGDLKPVLNKDEIIKIEGGIFENLEVSIYAEQGDIKKIK